MEPLDSVRETIFAPATGGGLAGVAIVRVSGSGAAAVLEHVCGLAASSPRRAIRCRMVDPESGDLLDDGLAIWFPAPASFSGEDVAELHIHGGRATVNAVCATLGRMKDREGRRLRFAEPGEFSRRAFDNGKMDLTEIEGLADLVAAETEAQRRQALRQLEGVLGAGMESLRFSLVEALARFEAAIDFPDEDLPDGLEAETNHNILAIREEVERYLESFRQGERIREGALIAIVGAPNVGKSSLLNFLAGRDAAIVTDRAGTTRDVVEVRLDLGGFPVTLADTAGLREAEDEAEIEGVRRALSLARRADLRLVVFDGSVGLDEESRKMLGPDSIAVRNKIDLARSGSGVDGSIGVSVATGENLQGLLADIETRVAALMAVDGPVPLTRERHRLALEACRDALVRAELQDAVDLKAEDLRLAAAALGRVSGRVDVEEVLDRIFSEFCIGK